MFSEKVNIGKSQLSIFDDDNTEVAQPKINYTPQKTSSALTLFGEKEKPSQLSIFNEPVTVKDKGSKRSEKLAKYSPTKEFKGDIELSKDNKFRVKNSNFNQIEFEKLLDSYGSHTGVMKSPLPEHSEIPRQIKELHNGDEDKIRESFNNTTGRYKKLSEKPVHLRKSPDDLLLKKDGVTDEHHALFDMPESAKREMDSFANEKEFARAVREGNTSKLLTNYLQKYNATHKNLRDRVFYDNGKWKTPQGNDIDPLELFWRYPITSNRVKNETEDTPEEPLLENGVKQTSIFGDENNTPKELKKVSNEGYLGKKAYKPGTVIDFAGQKHEVLRDGTQVIKVRSEDGHVRDIKKDDLEFIQHKPYEFNPNISKQNLFKQLLGRNFEAGLDDTKVDAIESVPTQLKTKLKALGMSDQDIIDMNNYFATPKPKKSNGPVKRKSPQLNDIFEPKSNNLLNDEDDDFVTQGEPDFDLLSSENPYDEAPEQLESGSKKTPVTKEQLEQIVAPLHAAKDDKELKDTYRKLMINYHPDLSNHPSAKEISQHILENYYGLKNGTMERKQPGEASQDVDFDFLNKKKNYNDAYSKYFDVIEKHKDKFNKEFNPYGNPGYSQALTNKGHQNYNHKLETINKDSVLRAFGPERGEEYVQEGRRNNLNSEDIASYLGIKHNPYVQREIENVLRDLIDEGKLHRRSRNNRLAAGLRSDVELEKSRTAIINQSGNIVDLIKGLTHENLWEQEMYYVSQIKEYVDLVVKNSSAGSNNLDFYTKSLLTKSIIYSAVAERQGEVMQEDEWGQISKSLFNFVYELN